MFEDYSETEKLFNSLEKINIKDVKPGTVRFIEYAGRGAMGQPGEFTMLTEDYKLCENNFLRDKDVIDDIIRVIPEYEDMKGEFISTATVTDNWDILNLGMGNYLFVYREIAEDFYKGLKLFMPSFDIEEYHAYDPGELYLHWIFGAVYTLKKLNSEGEK